MQDSRMPPDDLITEHLHWCADSELSDCTIRDRRRLLYAMNRALPYGVQQASDDELHAYIYDPDPVTGRPRSAKTREVYRTHVQQFFRWATDPDVPGGQRLDYDPSRRLPRVKVVRGLPRPLDVPQVRAALALPEPWRLYVMLALYAGARVAEIAALRREDITAREVRINAGKGGEDRVVPTHPAVWEAVKDLPAGPLVAQWHEDLPRWLSGELARRLRAAGVDATAHQFRHTCATEMREAGVDLSVIQQILGHKSPATTVIYTRVSSRQRQGAILALPSYQPAAS